MAGLSIIPDHINAFKACIFVCPILLVFYFFIFFSFVIIVDICSLSFVSFLLLNPYNLVQGKKKYRGKSDMIVNETSSTLFDL